MRKEQEHIPILFSSFRDSIIGKNAKGIVHNINSPLQVLSMHLELLRMDISNLKDKLKGLQDRFMDDIMNAPLTTEILMAIEKSFDRFPQIDETLERINDLIKLISSRIDAEGEDTSAPLMVNQLLEEAVDFWKSDLFFKHSVSVSFDLPDVSPVVVTEAPLLRDIVDFILCSCIEQVKGAHKPAISIRYVPKGENHQITFFQNGQAFPFQEADEILRKVSEGLMHEQPWLEGLSTSYLSLAMALFNARRLKARLEADGGEIRLYL